MMRWPNFAAIAAMLHPTDVSQAWDPPEADPTEALACHAERCDAERVLADFAVVDLEERASKVVYPRNKKCKRTRYRPVDLSGRRVVIAVHQTGVERTEARWRQSAHRVTCHRFVGPTGSIYRVHPLRTRLVATNRFDRAPWHCIAVEVGGNFERVDGTGTWYKPDRFGRGRAGDVQLDATRVALQDIQAEVRELGGEVEACIAHIIAGRDERGTPNRQACCGSRVYSQVVEWAGAELGLKVPAEGFALGGVPIPPVWHGPYWGRCERFLTG